MSTAVRIAQFIEVYEKFKALDPLTMLNGAVHNEYDGPNVQDTAESLRFIFSSFDALIKANGMGLLPANSVRELIELARKTPGKLVLASGGIGAPSSLMGEMFKNLAKIDMVSVQYKGGGQAIADVIGGQASMMFADMIAAMPFVGAGRAKVLAVGTAKRIPKLPDVPTLIESGVAYDAIGWSGVFVPARTPAAIVNKLGAELRSILKLPDVQEKLASDGTDFGANTPQSLVAFVKSETEKYRIAVKVSGSKLE